MELQFNKTVCACLRKAVNQVQTQEQTQEVRLPDEMPDVGSVLGAWGQVLIRSKEWYNSGMGISCGAMVWILYAPEDGSEPRSVETWIPFQLKWEFPDTERDGTIHTECFLRNVDARSISARKLMVRSGISVMGEAMVLGEIEISQPGEVPEDVQVLKNSYPVCLPREAGEKPFTIEETLTLPNTAPRLEKLIRYELRPEITDKKIMSDKIVFRGTALLHIFYLAEDGSFNSWDFEIPFSQFTELDREYSQDATARISPAVTSLELETGENGTLQIKVGLTGQYMVCDTEVMEIVEDAYSHNRIVTPMVELLEMPIILDERRDTVYAERSVEVEGNKVADAVFYQDVPRMMRDVDAVQAELSGVFQMLYYDLEGNLQSAAPRWDGLWLLPADENSKVELKVCATGVPQVSIGGGNANLRAEVLAEAVTTAKQGLPMVTGLELGERKEPDPNRPSLILRKTQKESLWELAKNCGSTVEAIQKANRLTEEPEQDRILLIPVL